MSEIPRIDDKLKFYDNIQDFFKSIENRLIIFWVYKKVFTPYDYEVKSKDVDIYENNSVGTVGMIKEVVFLPDNDILLGIAQDMELINDEKNYYMDYYKLSEIHIAYNQCQELEYKNERLF